jgi:mannose-6-phosphate isomerase
MKIDTSLAVNKPLKFQPYFKPVIWGGEKIGKYKGVAIDSDCIGESWELSAVPGHESVVSEGEFAGKSITDLAEAYGAELLGTKTVEKYGKVFPLLIKLIDARSDLSVQVHPDDKLAKERHNCAGKTEMWYVVDCEKDANIYCGLSAALTPEGYVERIADNSIMNVVGAYKSAPGQFYFIPAGTIHAIGAGNLIAEIQQSSDITYRVYDYDRRDTEGNPRQLHTEEAKDAINYAFPHTVEPTAKSFAATTPGAVKSDYFTVDFLEGDGSALEYASAGESFVVLMATKGEVEIGIDGEVTLLRQGETALIPACVKNYSLKVSAQALRVTL